MYKVYKVGAIGTSWAARIPLPTFQSYRRTEIVAIASARMERAQEAAAKFGADRAFDDYREMVQLPDLDIVYVGGPVHLHHAMVMAALEAGKHVLCEKPLALNVAEAREMVDLAVRSGFRHVVAFTMRHYPWAFAIKQLIDDGYQVSPNLVDGLRCQEVNDAIKSSQLDGRRVEIAGPVAAETS